jgi:hypothetical protein
MFFPLAIKVFGCLHKFPSTKTTKIDDENNNSKQKTKGPREKHKG